MLGSVAIFVWGKRRFSWCLFAQEFFADLVDIAGAHGDQEVTGLAVFQKVVFDFIEGWEVFTGSSQFLDSFLKVKEQKKIRGDNFLLELNNYM